MIAWGIEPEPETSGHGCHVEGCGNRRCGTCDKRMMCTGPESAVNTCSVHDDECQSCNGDNPCRECAMVRRNQKIWDEAAHATPATMTRSEELQGHKAEQRKDERSWDWTSVETGGTGW